MFQSFCQPIIRHVCNHRIISVTLNLLLNKENTILFFFFLLNNKENTVTSSFNEKYNTLYDHGEW